MANKVINILKTIFVLVTTVTAVLGVALANNAVSLTVGLNILVLVSLFVGLVLAFTKKKLIARIGYALLTAAVVLEFLPILNGLYNQSLYLYVGEIMVIVSIVFLVAVYICLLLLRIIDTEETMDDVEKRVAILKQYKDMLDEGLIVQEEFEAKRVELLKLKKADTKKEKK